jgi:hypothetical protein
MRMGIGPGVSSTDANAGTKAKSSLEWSAQTAAQPDSDAKLVNAPAEKPGNPLDAQARATDGETFDALWRARIDHH